MEKNQEKDSELLKNVNLRLERARNAINKLGWRMRTLESLSKLGVLPSTSFSQKEEIESWKVYLRTINVHIRTIALGVDALEMELLRTASTAENPSETSP